MRSNSFRINLFVVLSMITKEEIQKVAKLARIEINPDEESRLAETISAVLDYMNILNEVDIDGVETTNQVTGLENMVREDIAIDCEYSEKLVNQFSKVKDDKLIVPKVFS